MNYHRILLLIYGVTLHSTASMAKPDPRSGFTLGNPQIQSISTMEFGSDGILFIGDSHSGTITAIETDDVKEISSNDALSVEGLNDKIAAALGTTPDNIIIHDMAVNPLSQTPYLAVSKANRKELGYWRLPNDVAQANIIIKVKPDGVMEEFSTEEVSFAQTLISNLIDPDKGETYRKSSLRVDAITDLFFHQDKLYVAGLSNEEFASTMRILDFPFNENQQSVSLEVYHAAHGVYETQAPVRTFVPYSYQGNDHMITAYTCTPLATFPLSQIAKGGMVKSKTVGEFGAGNIPMDMVVYQRDGKDYLMISNSTRNLMRVDISDIFAMEEGLKTEVKGFGVAGVPYVALPSNGIQQISYLNQNHILALVQTPGGRMDLRSLSTKWF